MKLLLNGVEVDHTGRPLGERQAAPGTAELKALRAELEALRAQPRLPADARARLMALKGVGEKLADEILETLTVSAAE